MEAINCKDILGKELYMDDKVVCRYYGSKLAIGYIRNITGSGNVRIDIIKGGYNLVSVRYTQEKIIKIKEE